MPNNPPDLKDSYKFCFQHSDTLFILLSKDFTLLEINRSAEKILGWKKKKVLNKKINHLFEEYATEPFIKIANPIKKAKKNTKISTKDQMLKISWDIIPHTEGIIIVGKDLTKQNDAQLENLSLENLIKYAPGFFYWKDQYSVYQGCNDEFARLAGLEFGAQVVGKTDFDLVWKDRAKHYVKIDKKVIKNGKASLNHEEEITISNDKIITAITNKVPLRNRKNKVIGILGITTDITQQKKVEFDLSVAREKAEAASHAKSEFIANMGHDIRTPLTGIIGFSDFLKDKIQTKDEKEYARAIHQSGEQLLQLLNGVLEVITVDAATDDTVQRESFNLRQMMEDLLALEMPAVKTRNLELLSFIDAGIPNFVVSDRMKIHRILLNLLGNAIKFTNKGQIELRAHLRAKKKKSVTIEFSVKDTGIGIPENLQDKVFDRFFKVSPSYKGKYTGNGIGLHIVQKFVGLLGSEMHFSSEEGKGTAFSFVLTLPIGKEPNIPTEENAYKEQLQQEKETINFEEAPLFSEKATSRDHSPNKMQVLLIEDSIMALKSLKLQMEVFNVEITEAMDGESGLDCVKKQPFDLIITDIGLPGISGDEMVQLVRDFEKKAGRKPALIFGLTGHAVDGELGKLCGKAGIDDLYQKPMRPAFLKKIMEKVQKVPEKNGLGSDLPDTESALFEINQHPLFDIQVGIDIIGSAEIVYEMMKDFKKDTIGVDLERIKKSHEEGDWETIRQLTHKIKGGACYGTQRLYYALLYMERYLKAGHLKCAEDLYTQMLRVIDETVVYLEN